MDKFGQFKSRKRSPLDRRFEHIEEMLRDDREFFIIIIIIIFNQLFMKNSCCKSSLVNNIGSLVVWLCKREQMQS
jgi:hypothetical protein